MQDRTPPASTLERIERASIDELRALQLQRLGTTLRRPYDHVPHYLAAFDAAGVFGAEPWTNDMRAEMERHLDLPVGCCPKGTTASSYSPP